MVGVHRMKLLKSICSFPVCHWPICLIVGLTLLGIGAGISLVVIGLKHSPERIPLESVEEETHD